MNISGAPASFPTTIPTTPTTIIIPSQAQLAINLRAVYIWVLVAVGLPGNAACLVTVLTMTMTTATFYVALLAVADTLALLVKLTYHQLATHRKTNAAVCYTWYTPHFFSSYANWVLVLICFERFFSVCFPLKKQAYFTKRKARISAVALAVVMVIIFTPSFSFFADWDGRACTPREHFNRPAQEAWATVVSALYFYIPFLLMSLFTTLIIVGMHRHRRARQAIASTGTSNPGNGGGAERSISIMLVGAALVFLALTLPTCLYHLFHYKLYDPSVLRESAQRYLFEQVVYFLADANHAVNFFIYFVTAAKFRRCFVHLLQRLPCCPHPRAAHNNGAGSSEAVRLTQLT